MCKTHLSPWSSFLRDSKGLLIEPYLEYVFHYPKVEKWRIGNRKWKYAFLINLTLLVKCTYTSAYIHENKIKTRFTHLFGTCSSFHIFRNY